MSGGVSGAIPGRAMRRVSSVPSRTQSPAYSTSISPSRGSLRASPGSAYGSPIMTEPKPLPSIFSSSTLPNSQRAGSPFSAQRNSPSTLRRMGSGTSASRTTSPYSARLGSPLSVAGEEGHAASGSSPARTGMTAVPQHYGSTLPRTLLHEGSDPYSTHSYEIYERMVPRPDSLAGVCVYVLLFKACNVFECVILFLNCLHPHNDSSHVMSITGSSIPLYILVLLFFFFLSISVCSIKVYFKFRQISNPFSYILIHAVTCFIIFLFVQVLIKHWISNTNLISANSHQHISLPLSLSLSSSVMGFVPISLHLSSAISQCITNCWLSI